MHKSLTALEKALSEIDLIRGQLEFIEVTIRNITPAVKCYIEEHCEPDALISAKVRRDIKFKDDS